MWNTRKEMNYSGIIKAIAIQSATVNSLCAGRIYPSKIPQKAALPAVVTTLVSSLTNDTKTGAGDRDTSRVQVDAFAEKLEDADNLADAIRGRLEYFFGDVAVGDTTYTVTSCRFLTQNHIWEDEKELNRVSHDYQISVNRGVTVSAGGVHVIDDAGNIVTDGAGNKVYLA